MTKSKRAEVVALAFGDVPKTRRSESSLRVFRQWIIPLDRLRLCPGYETEQ